MDLRDKTETEEKEGSGMGSGGMDDAAAGVSR
jgi:hypothetical protein